MVIELSERLQEERNRLGLSQENFGSFGDVGKIAQYRYETGERVPDARYLAGIASIGVDVQYLLTGVRSAAPESALAPDELALVAAYRKAPSVGKEFIRQASGMASSITAKTPAAEVPEIDLVKDYKPNKAKPRTKKV